MISENTSTPPLPQVPAMPATVATSFRLNRSDAIVITVTERVWCAKPPRHNSAIAVYGLSTNPTKAMPIISTAPTVKAPRRALIRLSPACFCSQRLTTPPNIEPRSAARNGIQAKRAICFRSKCRTEFRYSGIQNVSVPQVGSARNRGNAMPQKLRWRRMRPIDGRVPSPLRCCS